jgi:fibronectin type 3 domain-containing protein
MKESAVRGFARPAGFLGRSRNMKKHPGLFLAVFMVLLSSCPIPGGGGSNGGDDNGEPSPDGKTWVCFVNNNDFFVDVYNDSARQIKFTDVGAHAESEAIETTPNAGAVFYLRYRIPIDDVTLGYDGQGLAARIDAEKTTRITIPLLSELGAEELTKPVTTGVYIKIQNTGTSALVLRQGTSEAIPQGASSPIINGGETARYELNGGPVSNFSFMRNTVDPVAFPAGLTDFVPGRLYSFRFDGTALTLLADKPLTIAQALQILPPENISARSLANGSISLAWDRVGTETGYVIYRSESQTGTYTAAGRVDVTSYIDTGVVLGNTYYYRVSAVKNNVESEKSSTVVSALAEISSLASPGGLAVTGQTENSVSLSWQAVSNATGYKVYKGSSSGAVNEYVVEVASASYTVTDLTADTSYYFTVSAVYEIGESLPSAAVQGETSLSTPQGLSVTGQTENSVTLSWQAVSGAAGYKVYKGSSSDAVNEYAAETASASCTVTGLAASTSYYFAVSAVYEDRGSLLSAAVQGETSETMTPVPILTVGDQSLTVSWNPIASADSYNVYCTTAPILPGTPYQTGITGTSTVITGLANETTYYVWVETVNAGGRKTSESVSGVPQLPTIQEYTVYSAVSFTEAVAGINASPARGIYRITLFSNITVNNVSFDTVSTEKTIIIKGDTSLRTIYNTGEYGLFDVMSGKTLVLENNINLNGNAKTGNVVGISNGGILVMKAGSRIENANGYSAVSVYNGMFEMSGGEISGNTGSLGSVYVSGGVFSMSGGKVSGNTGNGVGVYGGTFTMSDGEISGNSGMGVSVNSYSYSSTFEMSGGKISGNAGDGVSSGGAFTMSGGEISENTGSGVSSGGTFTMSGGEISGNTGSGVFSVGIFTMSDGEISRNTGGGVGVSGTFKMSNGKIIENTGNGVSVYDTFEMSGGEISGNTDRGVYASNSSSTFEMSGGEISRNTGGGVGVSGTFEMSDGEISGNTTNYGGGVFVMGGAFTMSGGEISGNTSTSGGGVYVSSNGTFTKSGGGTIYGSDASSALKNTATNGDNYGHYGHAAYVGGSPTKKRDMTAGPSVNMNSNYSWSGEWE